MFIVMESSMSAITDSMISCRVSPIVPDMLYLDALPVSWAGIAEYNLEARPVGSIFLKSSSYSSMMLRFTESTKDKFLSFRYASIAWGIPPTSIYSLKSLMSFLCTASPNGRILVKLSLMSCIVTSSPCAHLNSS